MYDNLQELVSEESNFAKLREKLAQADGFCIPYLGKLAYLFTPFPFFFGIFAYIATLILLRVSSRISAHTSQSSLHPRAPFTRARYALTVSFPRYAECSSRTGFGSRASQNIPRHYLAPVACRFHTHTHTYAHAHVYTRILSFHRSVPAGPDLHRRCVQLPAAPAAGEDGRGDRHDMHVPDRQAVAAAHPRTSELSRQHEGVSWVGTGAFGVWAREREMVCDPCPVFWVRG